MGSHKHVSVSSSLLGADHGVLRAAAVEAVSAGADSIHVDFMDGHYVPNFAFGLDLIPALKRHVSVPIVCHLEIEEPEHHIARFADAGADVIVVQEDTCRNLPYCVHAIGQAGAAAGVAVNPDRGFEKLETHPEVPGKIELLIVMAVYPGFGNQSFSHTAVEKTAQAAQMRDRHGARFEIAVDGGVDRSCVADLVTAGCDQLIVGTALFEGGIAENMRAIRDEVSRTQIQIE